jgi:cobaltochelatase CobS
MSSITKFKTKKVDLTGAAMGIKMNASNNVELIESIVAPKIAIAITEISNKNTESLQALSNLCTESVKACDTAVVEAGLLRERVLELAGKIQNIDLSEVTKNVLPSVMEAVKNSELKGAVEKIVSEILPTRVVYSVPEKQDVDAGICHENFEKLLRMANARLNIALIGEAGSGKTHGAEQVAEVLGLKHYTISFHAKMTSTDLRGYMDAVGKYNASPLYTAFKNGGVLVLDEFDRANTEVVVSLNNLLAGRSYLFPNGEEVKKSPDLIIIACQNTTGNGPSKQYAAASKQDASTLNRFVKLGWNIDEKMEIAICGATEATRRVQAIRKKSRELGMDLVISPRQSIHANTLIASGFTLDEALHYSIFEGLAEDQIKRLSLID